MKVIVGMPIFNALPLIDDTVIVPAGQFKAADGVRVRYQNWSPGITGQQIVHEYGVIAEALFSSGHEPYLLHDFRYVQPVVLEFFIEMGYRFLNLELEDTGMLRFPRDVFTYLSEEILLVNPESTFDPIIQTPPRLRLVNSPFGEGGRVYVLGTKILCTEYFVFNGHTLEEAKKYSQVIENLGFEVVYLPNHLLMSNLPERGPYVEPDDHIDRVMGKVLDRNGNFHLILDPTLKVGMNEGRSKMLPSSKEGIHSWRKILERAGFQVHVPKSSSIPMSYGFYQMPCGKIIVTSGDDALIDVLLKIVPGEELLVLNPPIEVFPAQMGAGIHCLINELPDLFVHPRVV